MTVIQSKKRCPYPLSLEKSFCLCGFWFGRIFMFTLMEIGNWVDADQSTGRVIHIPNGKVFKEVLANYSKGFQYIWNEIPVLVTFESNWKKAKEIL